ncbi:hypothetical protein EYF80_011705 [Liparis tanakae]|uniref:Uncharacterized protein n=1 Tax=Liparis tanakae TaxID=230148 RepID=A0A4Z2IL96_9TELE|nr:hypothetical protein EYF80_011705 [Liparis tanakae]
MPASRGMQSRTNNLLCFIDSLSSMVNGIMTPSCRIHVRVTILTIDHEMQRGLAPGLGVHGPSLTLYRNSLLAGSLSVCSEEALGSSSDLGC